MKITPEQKQQVIDLFPHLPTKLVVQETGVEWANVRIIAHRNNLQKVHYLWKPKDVIFLLKHRHTMPVWEIAQNLNRTNWACYAKFRELKLKI